MSVGGLAITCNNFILLGSVGFRVDRDSGVNLINGGNTNGSAVLGLVYNLRGPAAKGVTIPKNIEVNCLPRVVRRRHNHAIVSRTVATFTSVFTLRSRLREVALRLTRERSCRSRTCRSLVVEVGRIGSHLSCGGSRGPHIRTRGALVNLNFGCRRLSHPARAFDRN